MARVIATQLRRLIARPALQPAALADGGGAPDSATHTAASAFVAKVSTRLSQAALLGCVAVAAISPPLSMLSVRPVVASVQDGDVLHGQSAAEPLQVATGSAAMSAPADDLLGVADTAPALLVGRPVIDVVPVVEPGVKRVAAAIVPPVRREAPRVVDVRVVDIKVEADPTLPKSKPLNRKFKTVRARVVAPGKALRATEPQRQILVASLEKPDVLSDLQPPFIALLPMPSKVLKGKVVSERKAKPIRRPAEAVAAAARAEAAKDAEASSTSNDAPAIVINTWTDDQIAEARAACRTALNGLEIESRDAPPLKEGACGAPAPIVVSKLGTPQVTIQPAAMLTCPMAVGLNSWLSKSVQPAARATYGVPVVRLISASSYACRNRYGAANTPLSEHALVNALDLSGFVLADGRTVKVLGGWGPVARDIKPIQVTEASPLKPAGDGLMRLGSPPQGGSVTVAAQPNKGLAAPNTDSKDRAFLQRVHSEACGTFGTVLGPEANDAHRNHFHLDMMARRRSAYCQ